MNRDIEIVSEVSEWCVLSFGGNCGVVIGWVGRGAFVSREN